MRNAAYRVSGLVFVPILLVCSVARADTAKPAEMIAPADPRFDVLELSNSAGGHTFASPVGTVLLSFVSKDSRYCRTARFPADRVVLLACREEGGWKVEAKSALSRDEATNPTAFGGQRQSVGDAVQALMASAEPLDEFEVIEAASKGWRDPVPVDERTFDARDILRKTALAYRASKSYVDAGEVRTVFTSPSREWTQRGRFKTAYVAPHDFRFEARTQTMPNVETVFVAWRDPSGVRAFYNLNPNFQDAITTLQSALDAGAGITRDASGMIPGLIIPGTKLGGDIVRLTDAIRIDDTQTEGVDCFRVRGFRWPNTGHPTTVWIGKQDFLIRRVEEAQDIKGTRSDTIWTYDPAINVPVDEDALRFSKPAS